MFPRIPLSEEIRRGSFVRLATTEGTAARGRNQPWRAAGYRQAYVRTKPNRQNLCAEVRDGARVACRRRAQGSPGDVGVQRGARDHLEVEVIPVAGTAILYACMLYTVGTVPPSIR